MLPKDVTEKGQTTPEDTQWLRKVAIGMTLVGAIGALILFVRPPSSVDLSQLIVRAGTVATVEKRELSKGQTALQVRLTGDETNYRLYSSFYPSAAKTKNLASIVVLGADVAFHVLRSETETPRKDHLSREAVVPVYAIDVDADTIVPVDSINVERARDWRLGRLVLAVIGLAGLGLLFAASRLQRDS